MATIPFLSAALSCSSDEARVLQVRVDRSSVISSIAPPPPEGDDCGKQQGPQSALLNLEIHAGEGDQATVIDDGGCQLTLRVLENRRYDGTNVDCTLTEGSTLRSLGVTRRTYQLFHLNLDTRSFAAKFVTLQNTSSGMTRSCGVTEGRIVDRQ